jgi:hypothetical protein
MARQIFAFPADDLAEPFLDFRIIDGIVIDPIFIAGVV